MGKIKDKLQGYKSYIVSGIAGATAFVGWLDGEVTLWAMLLTVAGAVGLSTIAAKVNRAAKPPSP